MIFASMLPALRALPGPCPILGVKDANCHPDDFRPRKPQEYEDISGPAIASWLQDVVVSDYTLVREVAAGVRGRTLIVNLPGRPAAIDLCLDAVFPAILYCLDLIGAGRLETDPVRLKSHRPVYSMSRFIVLNKRITYMRKNKELKPVAVNPIHCDRL